MVGQVFREALVAYAYVGLWVVLSGATITYNKFLLAVAGFPYPITLTLWYEHGFNIPSKVLENPLLGSEVSLYYCLSNLYFRHMLFCSTIAFVLVRSGRVETIDMDLSTYTSAIVPIGACYSVTLWVGNAAYLYLSVSFIQMLKALMPVSVFTVGCLIGNEKFKMSTFTNMLLIALGVAIASYGEINFNMFGVMLQLGSIASESIRLVLVQLLLQSRGLRLNPITTLYYVSPCCFMFLLVPFFGLEWLKIINDPDVVVNPFYLISNAMVAFFLNMAVFLLIGKTSALTMNVAGVVKDWMLIGISVWVFHSDVSPVNLGGYLIAFIAVCLYNYTKLQEAKQNASLKSSEDEKRRPLVPVVPEIKGSR